MRVEKFVDQDQAAAEAYGISLQQLKQRDANQDQDLYRWLAFDGDRVAGAVTGWLRSDDRMFLMFGCSNPVAYQALTEAVAHDLRRPVYVSADSRHGEDYQEVVDLGYEVEVTSEVFEVPFQPVLRLLGTVSVPSGFRVVSAADVSLKALFDLDNRLRQLVSGTDGWVGDIEWLKSELAESPPFDRDTYLVGLAPAGAMAGLVRIWRNDDGPRFGMVGTLPRYRRTLIGPALIKTALSAAAGWGHESFLTETSVANRHIHARLKRVGANSVGFIRQLVFGN